MGIGGLCNCEGLEIAIWLLGGVLDYLAYSVCLAVCECCVLHIWPVQMASQSMIGLVGGSMAQVGVDRGQNLIFDLVVAFLCVGNAEPDLMLLYIVDDAIVHRIT